jgi:hypothetical protein
MAGYGLQGGYAPPRNQPTPYGRSYGYGAQYAPANPFVGQQYNEVQEDYWRNNPQAVIASWMDANPYGYAPPAMRDQLQRWLNTSYDAWQARSPINPEQTFYNFLGERQPQFVNDYETGPSNPYARGQRAAFRTRWLTR